MMCTIRNSIAFASVIVLIAGGSASRPARADFLRDYNLVVTGKLSSNSEVEGRTVVGGNLTGSASNYATKLTPPSAYTTVDTLIVGGNVGVSGGNSTTINLDAGVFHYGGALTNANVNNNGGGQVIHSTTAPWPGSGGTAASELSSDSASLAALTVNSAVTLPGASPARSSSTRAPTPTAWPSSRSTGRSPPTPTHSRIH